MPLGGVIGIRDGVAEASGDGGVVLQGGIPVVVMEAMAGVVLFGGLTGSNMGVDWVLFSGLRLGLGLVTWVGWLVLGYSS